MAQIIHFFKPALLFVLTEKCFDEYFVEFDFLDADCFKSTLSKCLGLGLIAGSLLVKLPQILKLIENKSAEGLSFQSIILDLTAITIHASYNFVSGFPFSAWGDGALLGVQTAIIAYLVYYYAGQKQKAILFTVVYIIICIVAFFFIPLKFLWGLQACNVPILMSGKLLQAWTNYSNGSTGQLSAATVFMLTGGSIARIFTSIQETGDPMMIITFCASTAANLVLAFQMIYYWNVVIPEKRKSE